MDRELLKQAADYLRRIDKPLDMRSLCGCAINELSRDGEQFAELSKALPWDYDYVAARVFDISQLDANRIFGIDYPDMRATPSTDVAARIDELLAGE